MLDVDDAQAKFALGLALPPRPVNQARAGCELQAAGPNLR